MDNIWSSAGIYASVFRTSWTYGEPRTEEEVLKELERLKALVEKKIDHETLERRAAYLQWIIQVYEEDLVAVNEAIEAMEALPEKFKDTVQWALNHALFAKRKERVGKSLPTFMGEFAELDTKMKEYEFGVRRYELDQELDQELEEIRTPKDPDAPKKAFKAYAKRIDKASAVQAAMTTTAASEIVDAVVGAIDESEKKKDE